jgi:flavin-dependent dehydrogenase
VHANATGVEIDGELRARIVIGADGVESVVRRAIFPPKPRRLAVAIRGYQADVDGHPPTMVLDDRKGLAYAWYFPTRTGPANVGYGHLLTDDQPVTRHSLLTRMHQLLPWAELDPSALRAHRLPLSSAWQPAARGRILLVGDAASLVNPISGEGIYYAIASGLAAGAASVTTPQHAATRYTTALRHQFGRHQRHVALLAAMIRSPAVLEAGVRAAKLRQRVFEDIYALGLVDGPLTPQLVAGIIAELATHSRRPAAAHAYGV